MRRVMGLKIVVAYPGTLGDDLPEPPYGWLLVVDDLGRYITDDLGNFLIVEWNDG